MTTVKGNQLVSPASLFAGCTTDEEKLAKHVIACLKFEAELDVLQRIEALEAAAQEVRRR